MINRGIAAVLTIAFMTFVRPDAEPSRVVVTFLAILLYETIRWSLDYTQKVNPKNQKRKHVDQESIERNNKARKEEGERLDDMLFNPIKEVV